MDPTVFSTRRSCALIAKSLSFSCQAPRNMSRRRYVFQIICYRDVLKVCLGLEMT